MYVSDDGNAVFVEDSAGDRVFVDRLALWDEDGNKRPVFEVSTQGVPCLSYGEMLLLHREIGRMLGLGSPAPSAPVTASKASASAHAGQVRR